MMGWSINWDKVATCGSAWEYAVNYNRIFVLGMAIPTGAELSDILQAYPNPATKSLTIRLAPVQPAESRLLLYDPSGRKLWEKQILKEQFAGGEEITFTIPLSDLRQGIYLLQCEMADKLITRKIVVTH
jgi:hypothetical protein